MIETNRGCDCGRVIYSGNAADNTGIPGTVMGWKIERVVRSLDSGIFESNVSIGDQVQKGNILGHVEKLPIISQINGPIRGLVRNKIVVKNGMKIGDIEPRKNVNLSLVSDKALTIGGAVLEAIMHRFNY